MKLKRTIVGSILIIILFILCINYFFNYESHLEHPSTGTILSKYPKDPVVSVSGEVISLNNDGFDLQDEYNEKKVTYKIKTPTKVELGDNAQVLGKLGPDYTIKSTDIIITKKWSYEFVLIRSAFALIFLIFIFLRYWKFDFNIFEFVRLKENRACKHEVFVASKSKILTACKSERFAASKTKFLTVFLNHKILKNLRFLGVRKCRAFSKIFFKILRRR